MIHSPPKRYVPNHALFALPQYESGPEMPFHSIRLPVRFTLPDKEGNLLHAEMRYAGGMVMLGPASKEQCGMSPLDLPGVNQGLYVYVDNMDAPYRNAKTRGAVITMDPAEMFWGDRIYAAKDLEGHRWTFAQHVKDVAPEDMQPPGS
jgi:uncharacterized glyoxalase superfamily protein PhnB